MAWVNAEKKAKIKVALDEALKGTGVKCTLAVDNHSTIVCTMKSGPIDFIANYNNNVSNSMGNRQYIDVNPYWYQDHFTGEALDVIAKIIGALNTDNFSDCDMMSDYHHVGHYVRLNIGKWNKPYEVKAK